MGKRRTAKSASRLPGALFQMEPDLQTLTGLLLACRVLGEADDHIEPAAIGAIARCGLEALERVTDGWQSLLKSNRAGRSI